MAREAIGSDDAVPASPDPQEGCRKAHRPGRSEIVRALSPGSLTDLPGARESNAGDEFHVLWGVSLCLKMIQPASPLKSVVIEDVDPLDRSHSPNRAFLAADITEYYGGSHFKEATDVVVSQLKYSHRNPTEPWTAARLAPKGRPRKKTILGKFTDAYSEFRRRYGREAVLSKLKIRLIGNQPCGPTLRRLVKRSQALLASEPESISNQRITQSLDGHARNAYNLLFRRSGLEDREFTDFISVLDLDYLGTGDRFEQRRRIVTTLGKHVLTDALAARRSLCELVREMALPEAAMSPGIRQADVLARLEVTGRSDLFPLRLRVEIPDFVVRQPSAKRLAQIITNASARHIVAHGDAGVGKTVTLIELEKEMPGDLIVVLYDCYAGGEYLGPTERRHDPRYAIRQLINEIALECGTPLLLPGFTDDLALWQRLEQVLDDAAESLEEEGVHLVLAIDAADNAVIASRERQGEPCFVPDLWRIRLPKNVHIVMTCRSARMDVLDAPDDARMIELAGFDEASSTEHLRHYFPNATSAECREFHDNSDGNPRVQAYVLNPDRVDRPPTPAGCADEAATTLGDRFEDLVQTAVDSRLDADDSSEWLAVLMALERPIRVESLVMVLGAAAEEVSRFCHGLVPGVRIEDDTIVFRDEDFETYIRDQSTYEERIAAHGRIATCYMTAKDAHDWAAEALAGHLFNAGRAEDLIALTLEDRELSAIADPLARSQTYLSRVRLALRTPTTDRSDSIKLIVLAAAAKRADSALAAIIGNNPELSMRYGDPVAVARVYEAKRGEAWKGPLHMRVAAGAARRGDAETARTQLALAEAWLRRWSGLDNRDRQQWRLKKDDIAAWAEAIFHLASPEAAAQAIGRWHPEEYALGVAEHLVERLGQRAAGVDLALWIEQEDLPIGSEVRLLGILFQNGGSAPPAQLQRVCRHLIEQPLSDVYERDTTWPAELIEQAASVIDDAELLDLIEVLRPSLPNRAPYYGLADWEVPLRFACLEAVVRGTSLDTDDLLPTRLRDSIQTDTELTRRQVRRVAEERTKLLRVLQEALPLYRLRASSAARRMQADEVVEESLRLLQPFTTQRYYRDDRPHRFNQTANAVFGSLCLTDANPEEPCKVLLSVTLGDTAPLSTWLDVAELMIRRGTHTPWALHLVDRVVRETQVRDEPLREKTDRLLRCTALVDPIDETLATDYYSEAIKASSGLDEERARILDLMNHLANSLPESHRQEGSALAPRLRQAVEYFRPFVFDPDRLPWTETLATVTRLSPDEGVRTLTLWDESGDLHLERGVASVAKALADRGAVDVVEATQLLWLMDESMSCTQSALEVLEQSRKNGASRQKLAAAVTWLGERITRHLTIDARVADAKALAPWIETHEFEYACWASDIVAIEKVSEGLAPRDEPNWEDPSRNDESAQRRRDRVVGLLAGASFDRPEDLAERLERFAEVWASSEVDQYLSRFGDSISPDQRLRAIEALTRLPPDESAWRMNSYAIVKVLARWTSAWGTIGSVRNWVKHQLPGFFLERFLTIVVYGYEEESLLAEYLSINGIDDPGWLLLEATSRHLRDLDPNQLILIGKVLSSHLPEETRLGDLTWILNDLVGDTDKPASGPTIGRDELLLPELAWALLGHPDKFVRWRAAHFVLDRSRKSSTFVDHLMHHFDDQTGLGYYAPTSKFLWMSAQVWTMLTLRRLAVDAPESVCRFAQRLEEIATCREWPHALLREIARSTLSELPSQMAAPVVTRLSSIAFANRPAACQIERRYPTAPGQRRVEDIRFWFDPVDTIPYWFQPLGRLFGISRAQVETRAEDWVMGQLGFDNTTVRTDRPTLRDRYGYEQITNDHGMRPRVEDLQTYLEWHAMFLVAGDLADSGTPIIVHNDEPPEDPWINWLTSFLDPTGRLWISDHRDPVPLDRYLHALDPQPEMWRDVSDADFDRELLVENALVVYASVYTYHESLYETVDLDSALVNPESAESLLVYLQNTSTPYHHPLPTEGDRHDLEINEPGFELLGWLTDLDHDGSRLDEHDPLRRISFRTVVPGRAFQNAIAGTYPAHEWQTSIHPLRGPVTIRRWSDEPADRPASYHPRYTEGRQTLVRLPELLSFLSAVDKDLILKVLVSRHFRRHVSLPDEQEERYDPGTARIYLLRRDGTLTDGLGRGLSAGTGDHLTTEHQ